MPISGVNSMVRRYKLKDTGVASTLGGTHPLMQEVFVGGSSTVALASP